MKNILLLLSFLATPVLAGGEVSVTEYIEYVKNKLTQPVTVGFDLDDTLLDNQPSWIAAATAVQGKIFTPAFWAALNNSTCENDAPKTKVAEIVKWHQSQGHTIVVITARAESPNHRLATCLKNTYGQSFPVIFAPDGKTEALQKNQVQVFYGDSNSDITYAKSAGALPVRILRSNRTINPSPVHIDTDEIVIEDSDAF